jgi:hypothetical protein
VIVASSVGRIEVLILFHLLTEELQMVSSFNHNEFSQCLEKGLTCFTPQFATNPMEFFISSSAALFLPIIL